MTTEHENRLRRLKFRAWHRGTKESDLVLGGFVDSYMDHLDTQDIEWLERLMEEEDVMILAWIMGHTQVPDIFNTDLMRKLQKLDYVPLPQTGSQEQHPKSGR